MGNEQSSSDVEEDQEESTADINPPVGVEVQNGPVTLQSSPVINAAPQIIQESSKGTVLQENVISSSQKTIVISPLANGVDAKPPAPPAKSKFRLTISRPAPGRTAFQPNGPENGEVLSEVRVGEPALIQTQNKAPVAVETNVNMGGGANQAPSAVLLTDDATLSPSEAVEVESSPPKPREVSIFHWLFRPERKVQLEEPEQPEIPENQDVVININQSAGLQSVPPGANLQIQNVDIGSRAAADGQSAETASVPVGPESCNTEDATQASPQPEIHPVMSFFKTLVNKPVLRSEEEMKPDKEDKKKENGGLRKSSSKKKEKGKSATLQPPEKEVKGQKKADSSKSSTLGRLFRPKSKKDEVQTSGDKVVLELPVVSVAASSAEQSAPQQLTPQDAKPSNVPPQITASPDDGKSAREAAARPRLFWRKSFKGDPQPNKIQENGVEELADVSVNTAPEPTLIIDTNPPEVGIQTQEEEKEVKEAPPRPLPFWRKSFKADPRPPKVQENIVVQQPVVSVSLEQSAPEQPAAPETQPLEADKPSPDSERLVKEASSRPMPFWRKSFKGESQPQKVQESVAIEQPVVSVSLNTEKSAPEQILAPDVEQADVITTPENEKLVKEAASRPVPFWRKSFKAEPQPPKTPENSSLEEPVTIQLTETSSTEPDSQSAKPDSGAKTSPTTEGKSQQGKKTEEGKNSKPKIMMFFKQLSVMGDPNNGTSEEVNGKISPTLDITDGVEVGKSEKTVVTAVVEPPPAPPLQKAKENPKDWKKGSSEKLSKQESRESPEAAASSQAQAIETSPGQDGAEYSKDGQMKRVEKRQSLGSFFKAMGPKRLCDAEVQTDPVSILPAEKAK
ncbi:breast carcinoma-amplified sequence 1 [Mantella aurantiaca]